MKIVYAELPLFAELAGLDGPPLIAEAIAFGPLSWIRVGPEFTRRPEDERAAILAHEEGHVAGWHTAKRLLWCVLMLPLWAPDWVARHCLQQEFAADTYARELGHGAALLRALRSLPRCGDLDRRIARLEGEMVYE
jgi:hypothetical protein